MRQRALGRVAAAVALAASLVVAAAPAGADGDLQHDDASGLEFLEITTGGATAGEALPIVIAIHGLGDNPDSFRLLLDDLPTRARVIFPRGPTPHGTDGFSWFDFRADDDDNQTELGKGIHASSERLAKLIVSLSKARSGPDRVVVCGFSQGGMLTFALAAEHPELVAEAIPISGFIPPSLWPPERPKTRPLPRVAALHGEADKLVPVEKARWSVDALKANGYEASLRTWPGVGHALMPEIRAALEAAVMKAADELSQAGGVLPGPPAPKPAAPDDTPDRAAHP